MSMFNDDAGLEVIDPAEYERRKARALIIENADSWEEAKKRLEEFDAKAQKVEKEDEDFLENYELLKEDEE
jgi:hypothetical protein